MAVIQPVITGDYSEDAWKRQITDAINTDLAGFAGFDPQAMLDTFAGTVTGAGGQATIQLWQRTTTNVAPEDITTDTTFDYSTNTLADTTGGAGPWQGWTRNVPDFSAGDYLWRIVVNIADDVDIETISASAWSPPVIFAFTGINPDNVPVPTTPTDIAISRLNQSQAVLTWGAADTDTVHPGLVAQIQTKAMTAATWDTIAVATYPTVEFVVEGVLLITENQEFRIRYFNLLGEASGFTTAVSIAPPIPATPIDLSFERLSADAGRFSWTHAGNDSLVKSFILEARESGGAFAQHASIDADRRQFLLLGLATESSNTFYRITAISVANIIGSPSSEVEVGIPVVPAPIDFVATPVERVGVLTTVDLTWTRPASTEVNFSTVTIQFRPVTTPASDWVDVQTVSADEFEVDNIPPQQGFVQYRARFTALNGSHSDWTESPEIFISGGSATDDAIFGGDGAFISQPHYSIDNENFYFNAAAAANAIISGGNIVGNQVIGEPNTQLEIDWFVNISRNQVDRRRHFYLNLGDIMSQGETFSQWELDNGTVFIEVLSDPADTQLMYHPGDQTDPDEDFVYTDSGQGNDENTRSYDGRNLEGNMFATRSFIRLPMRRTFTFRDPGRVCIRIRFVPIPGRTPVIQLDPLAAQMRLEAFATELVETYALVDVQPAGQEIEFRNNFEAPPCVFTSSGGDFNSYWTSKSRTRVVIHHQGTGAQDIDVTVRGY